MKREHVCFAFLTIAIAGVLAWCIARTVTKTKTSRCYTTTALAVSDTTPVPTLADVLTAGDSANKIPIRNVGSIGIGTSTLTYDGTNLLLNGAPVPTTTMPVPSSMPTLQTVLSASPDAGGYSMTNVGTVDVNGDVSIGQKLIMNNISVESSSLQNKPALHFTLPNKNTGMAGDVFFQPRAGGPVLYDMQYDHTVAAVNADS